MKQISKTENGIKALNWLHSQRTNHEFNWEKPTTEDHKSQHCWVVNEYGPNPHGITKPAEINKMYLSSYSNNWSCEKRA